MDSITVFSHLRWDFVFQRPQHLLSRLAKRYRILFFEEAAFQPGDPAVHVSHPLPNLTVCSPTIPTDSPSFHDDQMPYLRQALRHVLLEHGDTKGNRIAWFYTPMALPLAEELKPDCIIYDCMDELSAFKNPPPGLMQREDTLLKIADIVFTGGPSLYNAKKDRNPNVHCFPSSVDIGHFRQALDRNIAHPAHRGIARPRLGFYGVIDERFDAAIVADMADAHPEWQIILVGPVVKIDPGTLPRRPNIHYMGQQSYTALPQFLAAWDVCLMPFALNESTRFISPTKSLEYMAAELPIVSTPVRDVVDLHSDVVEIASGSAAFIGACEHALNLSSEENRRKVLQMREKLSKTSWDVTAAQMHQLMQQAVVPQGKEQRVTVLPKSAPPAEKRIASGASNL